MAKQDCDLGFGVNPNECGNDSVKREFKMTANGKNVAGKERFRSHEQDGRDMPKGRPKNLAVKAESRGPQRGQNLADKMSFKKRTRDARTFVAPVPHGLV